MKTTPLPPFESEGFENTGSAFPHVACSGESSKIPGVREVVRPEAMDISNPPRRQIQCITVVKPRENEIIVLNPLMTAFALNCDRKRGRNLNMFFDELELIARGTELARKAVRVNNGITKNQRIAKAETNPEYNRPNAAATLGDNGIPWWKLGPRAAKRNWRD